MPKKIKLEVTFDTYDLEDDVSIEDTMAALKCVIMEQDFGEGLPGVVCSTVTVREIIDLSLD